MPSGEGGKSVPAGRDSTNKVRRACSVAHGEGREPFFEQVGTCEGAGERWQPRRV